MTLSKQSMKVREWYRTDEVRRYESVPRFCHYLCYNISLVQIRWVRKFTDFKSFAPCRSTQRRHTIPLHDIDMRAFVEPSSHSISQGLHLILEQEHADALHELGDVDERVETKQIDP